MTQHNEISEEVQTLIEFLKNYPDGKATVVQIYSSAGGKYKKLQGSVKTKEKIILDAERLNLVKIDKSIGLYPVICLVYEDDSWAKLQRDILDTTIDSKSLFNRRERLLSAPKSVRLDSQLVTDNITDNITEESYKILNCLQINGKKANLRTILDITKLPFYVVCDQIVQLLRVGYIKKQNLQAQLTTETIVILHAQYNKAENKFYPIGS